MLRDPGALPLECKPIVFAPPSVNIEGHSLLCRRFIKPIEEQLKKMPNGFYEVGVPDHKQPYSILKQDVNLYVLNSAVADEGRSGVVTWAQRLSDLEWVVIKKSKAQPTELQRQKIISEHTALQTMNRACGPFIACHSTHSLYLVMKGEKGINVAAFLQAKPILAAIDWLILAEGMAAEVSSVHSAGMVHRDIKPENFIVDRIKGQVRLVDFGDAVPIDKAARLLREGTRGFDAPEVSLRHIQQSIQTGSEKAYGDYSTATDVYALGQTLKALFGLEKPIGRRHGIRYLYAPSLVTQLEDLFNKMTHGSSDCRPSMLEVSQTLQTFRETLLPVAYAVIGVMDIDDYIWMIEHDFPVSNALQAVSEVVLIVRKGDKNKLSLAKKLYTIKPEIEKENHRVSHRVYYYNNLGQISALPAQLTQLHESDSVKRIYHYCFFYPLQRVVAPAMERIQNIPITYQKNDYYAEIANTVIKVTLEDKEKVVELLRAEVDRLSNRWWPKAGTSILSCRLIDISQTIGVIESHQSLTYSCLFQELDNLQAKMVPTLLCLTWFLGFFGYKRVSTGAKKIAAIEQAMADKEPARIKLVIGNVK